MGWFAHYHCLFSNESAVSHEMRLIADVPLVIFSVFHPSSGFQGQPTPYSNDQPVAMTASHADRYRRVFPSVPYFGTAGNELGG